MKDKMLNTLRSLNNMEMSYMELAGKDLDYSLYNTYSTYLNTYFIKSHHLEAVYWPQIELKLPHSLLEYPILVDQMMILAGQNISMGKQISFPCDFSRKNSYFSGIYLLEGEGALDWEDRTFTLSDGDFFLLAPDVEYRLNIKNETIAIHIMIRRSFIERNYMELLKQNPVATSFFHETLYSGRKLFILYHTKSNSQLSAHVLEMFAEYLWGDEYSPDLIDYKMRTLFIYLLRHKESEIETNVAVTGTQRHYNQFLTYLKKNYQTVTLSSMADEMHFSKQYICKIIREAAGVTFLDVLTSIRLEHVKTYLRETQLTLEDISELCGFSDAAYLSRVFKKVEGISPSQYRKGTS